MDKGNEKILSNGKLINKYMDLKHSYDVVVPIYAKFNDALYENDIFDKEGKINSNFKKMSFNEVVFTYIDSRLFGIINIRMKKIIDMYEEEYFDVEEMQQLFEITEEITKNNDDKEFLQYTNEFKALVKYALDNKCILGCLF